MIKNKKKRDERKRVWWGHIHPQKCSIFVLIDSSWRMMFNEGGVVF